jgi:hypothetical protein
MADHFMGAFFVLAIIMFSVAGAGSIVKFMEGSRECNKNTDCGGSNYCGSDFKCHSFPVIENTVVKSDWTTPAAILGLAIVLAALILRKKQQPPRQFY